MSKLLIASGVLVLFIGGFSFLLLLAVVFPPKDKLSDEVKRHEGNA